MLQNSSCGEDLSAVAQSRWRGHLHLAVTAASGSSRRPLLNGPTISDSCLEGGRTGAEAVESLPQALTRSRQPSIFYLSF